MRFHAVVLARGGSRRIPGKNLRKIMNRSLVQIAVEEAVKAGLPVFVSSDDLGVLEVAKRYGAVPHERSPDTSSAIASSESALREVCEARQFRDEDLLLLLPPTSPFRRADDIKQFCDAWIEGIGSLSNPMTCTKAISVIQDASEFLIPDDERGFRMLRGGDERRMEIRTPWFRESGAIYGCSVAQILDGQSLVDGHLLPVVGPDPLAVDINTEADLTVAEALASIYLK